MISWLTLFNFDHMLVLIQKGVNWSPQITECPHKQIPVVSKQLINSCFYQILGPEIVSELISSFFAKSS